MATTRVTTFTYDFRGRRVVTDGEVDFCEKRTYDNLDRVTKVERYDTICPSMSSSSSSSSGGSTIGNLIARSETKYDNRGRVYQNVRYGVDPATGTVGNSLTDNSCMEIAARSRR